MVESLWNVYVLSMNSWRIQWNKIPNFSRWDNFSDFHPLWISLYRLWLKETLLSKLRLLSNRFFPLLFKKLLLLPTCNPTSIWNVFGCYMWQAQKKYSLNALRYEKRIPGSPLLSIQSFSSSLLRFRYFQGENVSCDPSKKLRSYHSTILSVSCLFTRLMRVSCLFTYEFVWLSAVCLHCCMTGSCLFTKLLGDCLHIWLKCQLFVYMYEK